MVYTPSVNMPLSIKWRESSDAGVFNVQNPLIPVIRLSEMYYIAGESIFDTDPEQAIDWLDAARLGRGCKLKLPRTLTKAEFLDRIELDARREYIAEGQLFYFYKRLGYTTIPGSVIPADERVYKLPMPKVEIDFGGRNE